MKRFQIVKVSSDYCDYLRVYDYRVPYNKNEKELRPFIGVLFIVNQCMYYAPLSSPKKKHLSMKNNIDFYRIDKGVLGAINFNNMIPVLENNYELVELDVNNNDKIETVKYKRLLRKQLDFMNDHYNDIKDKAQNLYNRYINGKLPFSIKERCCDFTLLEEKCKEYK